MKRSAWKLTGMLAVAGWASAAAAQTPLLPAPGSAGTPYRGWGPAPAPPVCTTPMAPGSAAPSVPPSGSTTTPSATTPSTTTPNAQDPTDAFRGPTLTNFAQSNVIAAGSGSSVTSGALAASTTSAAAGGKTTTTTVNTFSTGGSLTPTILPGLLTAATVQSARPVDRVYFGYSYLDRFQVVGGGFSSVSPGGAVTVVGAGRQPGFNLNVYNVGVEKTLFNGMASVYVLAPFLQATDNISGQAITGPGDVSAGMKWVLYSNPNLGALFTGGMTVTTPTAHNTTYVNQTLVSGTLTINNVTKTSTFVQNPTQVTTTTTNPTYLQPWAAALYTRDRLFIQEYIGVIVPTDGVVSTFINNDLALGYQVFRGDPGRLISSITPVVDVQTLLPINHIGGAGVASSGTSPVSTTPPTMAPTNNLNFSNQVFLTTRLQVGLGQRAMLSAGIITPLAGPKGFNYGVTVGLNIFY